MPFSTNYSNRGYSIYSFCGLYLIGMYLRKSNIINRKFFNSKANILSVLIIVTIFIALGGLSVSLLFEKGRAGLQLFPMSPISYNNPLVIIQSILIFILFTKLSFNSKVINYMAGSALAIYLLHMHPDLKDSFNAYVREMYDYSLLNQYLSIMLLMIAITLIAIPVDKLRLQLFNKLYDRILCLVCKSI